MLATTLPTVHLITKSAHHSTRPPSYTITGLQCTHGPRLAGPTRFQATPPLIYQMAKQSTWLHRHYSLLTIGEIIYLATPYSTPPLYYQPAEHNIRPHRSTTTMA